MEFLYVSVHAPRKLRNVGRFHGNDPTAATLRSVPHVLHVHARSAFLRGCEQARYGSSTGTQAKSISKEITSVLHSSPSSKVRGPNCPRRSMDIGSKRGARPGSRHQVAALAIPLLGRKGGNSDAKN